MKIYVVALVWIVLILEICGDTVRHHRHNSNGTSIAHAPFHCDSHAADQLSNQFVSLRYDGSACPKEDWLPLMARADPDSDKILVNVGFNKGYNFAVWMSVFAPWMNITSRKWEKLICPNATGNECCGVCDDCKMEFPSLRPHHRSHGHGSLKQPQITMVGVELNEENVVRASSTMAKVSAEVQHNGSVRLFPYVASMSNRVETQVIRRCPFGDEGCSLGGYSGRLQPRVVNTTTVDIFMEEFSAEHSAYMLEHHSKKVIQFPHLFSMTSTSTSHSRHYLIDLLMIDVEGYDAKVLEGSHSLLSQHAIRALVFEYHYKSPWKTTSLEKVVKLLEAQDFDCYFQGQGRLWPITSGCWNSRYEFHQWSNVMCVQKGDVWHAAIQPLVHRNVSTSTSNVLNKMQRKENASSTPWKNTIVHHYTKWAEKKQNETQQLLRARVQKLKVKSLTSRLASKEASKGVTHLYSPGTDSEASAAKGGSSGAKDPVRATSARLLV